MGNASRCRNCGGSRKSEKARSLHLRWRPSANQRFVYHLLAQMAKNPILRRYLRNIMVFDKQ